MRIYLLILFIFYLYIEISMEAPHSGKAKQACRQSLDKKRIVIVGGGMAGLTAASELFKAGFKDVSILEGSNRIGGRIFSVPQDNGGVLEIGAQWIHGEQGNPLYNLAKQNNLLYNWKPNEQEEYEDMEDVFKTADGKLIPESVVDRTSTIIDEIFEEAEAIIDELDERGQLVHEVSKASTNKHQLKKNKNGGLKELISGKKEKKTIKVTDGRTSAEVSIGAYVRRKFAERLNQLNPTAERRRWMESLFGWRMLQENTESACPSLDDISFAAWNDYYVFPGDEDSEVGSKGYKGLIDIIKANIPASSINLNTHVEKIQWQNDDKTVKIVATGGKTYTADNVIVTSSLGYLKANRNTLFVPPLPLQKSQAIDKLGFGTMDKIFLFFDDDMEDIINFVWHPTDKYSPQLNGQTYTKPWYRSLYIFFPILQQPKVMVGFIAGDAAKTYEPSISDGEVLEICHQLLKKFSGKADFPRPKKILRSKWFTDKYAHGSYSYRKVGSTMEDSVTLAKPLKVNQVPVVLFAGEASHENLFSTTTGAYRTGQREADRLKKLYCG